MAFDLFLFRLLNFKVYFFDHFSHDFFHDTFIFVPDQTVGENSLGNKFHRQVDDFIIGQLDHFVIGEIVDRVKRQGAEREETF